MSAENISLEFKTPNGVSIKLKELYEEDSIEFIKQKIQDESGIPMDQMRLIFNGKKLEDHYSISDCKLLDNSTVRLVVAVR